MNIFVIRNSAQTRLLRASEIMNMDVNLPSSYSASQNEDWIYVTPITEASPVPRFNQSYRYEPSKGSTAFKVFFGLVTSILRHQDSECVIFIYIGDITISTKGIMAKKPNLFSSESMTFNRIKCDFQYGIKNQSASKNEIDSLNKMITHFPKKTAKKMFNTNWMVGYSYNLAGEVYENKLSIVYVKQLLLKRVKGIYSYILCLQKPVQRILISI